MGPIEYRFWWLLDQLGILERLENMFRRIKEAAIRSRARREASEKGR